MLKKFALTPKIQFISRFGEKLHGNDSS